MDVIIAILYVLLGLAVFSAPLFAVNWRSFSGLTLISLTANTGIWYGWLQSYSACDGPSCPGDVGLAVGSEINILLAGVTLFAIAWAAWKLSDHTKRPFTLRRRAGAFFAAPFIGFAVSGVVVSALRPAVAAFT